VIADVFKIVNDPFVGKLSVFRVFQGTVRRDSQLFVDDGRKPFKVGHLYRLKGKDHVEVDRAIPGDIAAVAKVEDIHFDAVLHDSHDEDDIRLAPLDFPRPMFGLAIEAATRGQEQKLATALHKLAEEDPGYAVEHDTELNQTVVRALGELHLRVLVERIRNAMAWTCARGRRASPTARPSAPRPRATTGTRSRPVAPGSSARCSCGWSRWPAAPASSSWTR
jgi:elongation factor G